MKSTLFIGSPLSFGRNEIAFFFLWSQKADGQDHLMDLFLTADCLHLKTHDEVFD